MPRTGCYTGEELDAVLDAEGAQRGGLGSGYFLQFFPIKKAKGLITTTPENSGIRECVCNRLLDSLPKGSGYSSLPYKQWAAMSHPLSVLTPFTEEINESLLRILCLPGILPDDAEAVACVVYPTSSRLNTLTHEERLEIFHLDWEAPDVQLPGIARRFNSFTYLTSTGDKLRGYPQNYSEDDIVAAEICSTCATYQSLAPELPEAAIYGQQAVLKLTRSFMEKAATLVRQKPPFSLAELLSALNRANWAHVEDLFFLRPHQVAGELARKFREYSTRFFICDNACTVMASAVCQEADKAKEQVAAAVIEMGFGNLLESGVFLELCLAGDLGSARCAFASLLDDPTASLDDICRMAVEYPTEETSPKRPHFPKLFRDPESPDGKAILETEFLPLEAFSQEDLKNSNIKNPEYSLALISQSLPCTTASFAVCLGLLGAIPQGCKVLIPLYALRKNRNKERLLLDKASMGELQFSYCDAGDFGEANTALRRYLVPDEHGKCMLTSDAPVSDKILSAFDEHQLDALSASLVYRELAIEAELRLPHRFSDHYYISPGLVDALSCGLVEFGGGHVEYTRTVPLELQPLAKVSGIRKRLEDDIRRLMDLEKIWLHTVGWVPYAPEDKGYSLVKHIGRNAGVDSYVSAYLSGIPLEDLIS